MSEEKEIAKINWNGQDIGINRVWSGHRFTDEELNELADGKTIKISAVNKNGEAYECEGKLAPQEYHDVHFIGFERIQYAKKEKVSGLFNGEQITFNREWSDHRFTDEEVQKLLNGEEISFETTSKNTGNKYTATGTLQKQNINGREFYAFKRNDT